jgi:aryl-alcohol dehydrogenase-like predicted oxidoreductase
VQVHTKCVPDLDQLASLSKREVEAIVDRSLRRLGVEALDLVQLHWWDYRVPGWMEAARWLGDIGRAGKVRHVGLTNFDTVRVREIVRAGVPAVSHQVQYSVLDRRPAHGMAATCEGLGIGLLAYGALAGGFLSERWLGQPAPGEPLENRSLVKYRLIIEEFGGWAVYQQLLGALDEVARKHRTTIGAVAVRWVMDQPGVAGVIVGVRHARHLRETVAATTLALDEEDRGRIARVQEAAPGPAGEVYDLERTPGGRHAAIMRYNLHRTG